VAADASLQKFGIKRRIRHAFYGKYRFKIYSDRIGGLDSFMSWQRGYPRIRISVSGSNPAR
jgi:hypothetical protein